MNYPDYFSVLDLNTDASAADIKKAYRIKARMYHPDLNHSPDAKDNFIMVTEAYEFLMANFDKIKNDKDAFYIAMEEWKKYRQDRARQRANAYAKASYVQFSKSKFYRTTRIFDLARVIFGLILSVLIILFTILGFITRLKFPVPEYGNPVIVFVMLSFLGLVFFVISIIHLKVYIETARKHRKKHDH